MDNVSIENDVMGQKKKRKKERLDCEMWKCQRWNERVMRMSHMTEDGD